MQTTNKPTVESVLKAVNKIRRTLHAEPIKELPKGLRYRSPMCPIANSFRDNWPHAQVGLTFEKVYVLNLNIYIEDKPVEVKFSKRSTIGKFLPKFDAGEYPEFEA